MSFKGQQGQLKALNQLQQMIAGLQLSNLNIEKLITDEVLTGVQALQESNIAILGGTLKNQELVSKLHELSFEDKVKLESLASKLPAQNAKVDLMNDCAALLTSAGGALLSTELTILGVGASYVLFLPGIIFLAASTVYKYWW